MTKAELARVLYELDVPPDLYRLDGCHFELANVLTHEPSGWVVFLSERGEQSDRKEFHSERDACTYLFGRICHDLVERRQLKVIRSTE
jgi:hypothetical protein